jgi:hypothetical protein
VTDNYSPEDEIIPQAIRKLTPGRLVIASHNMGKVREIAELLGPHGMEPVSAGALGLPEPEETGTTFIANAELKALAAADLSGLPALADDSGLCVEALGGDPGIFSARWAGVDKDFSLAMRLVHEALEAKGPMPDETRTSYARWRSPGLTGMSRHSKAGSMAVSSGRRAATRVSAMTRFSSPSNTASLSRRWTLPPNMR